MKAFTHIAIATSFTSLMLGNADAVVLGTSAIASQLPDIDTTKSYTGIALYPISSLIEAKFPHRGVTHSFAATVVIAIVAIPLIFWTGWYIWGALVLGYFWGWFADAFTQTGVCAFYPNPARVVIPKNPKNRLKPNSYFEYTILAVMIFLLTISINIHSNGGLSEAFARTVFRDAPTTSSMFFKYPDNQIFAHVEGVNTITGKPVNTEFKILEATKENFIGISSEDKNLYQIGNDQASHIRPNSVTPRIGSAIKFKSESINPSEIFVFELVKTLPPNAFLTGSIILDNLNDVRVPLILDRYPPISIFAAQIKLQNARPKELEQLIGEGFILSGNVIIKVRSDE